MKKLSLYVFLVLMFFSNVNASLDSKDKLTFDRCYCPVVDSMGENCKELSWEINFEKKTLTLFQEITNLSKRVMFQERYHSEGAINVNEPFIHIGECCDRTQYNFNMKTGKIIQIHGWTYEETVIGMCEIVD